ncbi:MAG: hypothetical protein GY750_14065 [Lentisphaerae bacterium]|nr:hypothetical protein [Lentisphaerota bacterium]MCP4102525.1 hypothetical protein [Lentisphaerota bacterium]
MANKRFWRNMRKIVCATYKWYRLTDWDNLVFWLGKAWIAYRSCVRFGWSAWID